jgi:uroporphyrinogen-III synthase
MRFSHIFLARPRRESTELASLLTPHGVKVVVQPAFSFLQQDIAALQPGLMAELESPETTVLIIFTSPRAVEFGLSQIPAELICRHKVAAIGPSTSLALKAAGIHVDIQPADGFTSEALLQALQNKSTEIFGLDQSAYIVAAPGGRRKMEEGLSALGWRVSMLMAYQRDNAEIDKQQLERLMDSTGVLSVWTSGNAMKSLSQRLPPTIWFRLCQGDWLVISDRLMRLARAYGPAAIHLSAGPGNSDLFSAIRALNFRA